MSRLTWDKKNKLWLHDGVPFAKRRRAKKPTEEERREQIRAQLLLHNPTMLERKLEYLVDVEMLSGAEFVKWARQYLRDAKKNGRCGGFGNHSWTAGECARCGAWSRKGHGKTITNLARFLKVPRRRVVQLFNTPKELQSLVKRARILKELNITQNP